MKNMMKLVFCLSLLGAVGSANAGHLFTQSNSNTPVALTAGQGVSIPQFALESGTGGGVLIYTAGWSAGDVLRLTIGAFIQDFSFDSPLAGFVNNGSSLSGSTAGIGGTLASVGALVVADDGISKLNDLVEDFTFRIDAIAGAFTLEGYRLRTSSGNIDGTNAGVVNQDQVTVTPPPTGVPAPAGLALLAIGLLGMRLSQRKKA